MIIDGREGASIVRKLLKVKPCGLRCGEIAQLVEQRTENPCVPGSIPGLATTQTPYPAKACEPLRHAALSSLNFIGTFWDTSEVQGQ